MQNNRTINAHRKGPDTDEKIIHDFTQVLRTWTLSRTRRNLILRLIALVIAAVFAATGLGVTMMRSGPLGSLVYSSILVAGILAIFYRMEVTAALTPYWNERVVVAFCAILVILLIFVPHKSEIFSILQRVLLSAFFFWPILGMVRGLARPAYARRYIAMSVYLKMLPKDEIENAYDLLRDWQFD